MISLTYMQRKSIISVVIISLLSFFAFSPVSAEEMKEPLVSLNVINAKVIDVMMALGKISDLNIIANDLEDSKITIKVNSMNLYKLLELIAKTKNLDYRQIDNVVIIGPKGMLTKNFGQLHIFKLNFADSKDVITLASLLLEEKQNKNFVEEEKKSANINTTSTAKFEKIDYNVNKRLAIDEATNSLLFYGSNEEADKIRSLLTQIDIAYQQVSLEAKVVAINKDAAKNLGIEWEWSKAPLYPERNTEIESVSTTIVVDGKEQTITERRPKNIVKRIWKDGEQIPGIISFGRGPEGQPFEFYYSAKLNAMIAEGKANILARPNIMTINGKEAVINIGGEVPVPTVSVTNSTTKTSIEYREAGIILRYIPRINKDGFITADVHTEVSSPVYVPDVKAYRFNKRSADTTVRLKDGETMVIGGLIGSEEINSISKIPILGDLPILGRFFSNIKKNKNESELMIFLTAHIVE